MSRTHLTEEDSHLRPVNPVHGKHVGPIPTPFGKIENFEWYDDTFAQVGSTPPTRFQQEQDVRKAVAPAFWDQSSIGPVQLLPGQTHFNLRPISDDAAKKAKDEGCRKEDVVTAVEKIEEESHFAPLKHVQEFFTWIWNSVTGAKSSKVDEDVSFELNDEQKKHLNNIITTMKELLRQINDLNQDSDEAVKFDAMMKCAILAREDESASNRERMLQQFKMQKIYRKERNTELEEQIHLAKLNDIQSKFDKLTTGIQLFIATLGISATASGVGGFVILSAAIGATIDPFLDDYFKKKIASGVSWAVSGNETTEKNTLSYIKIGVTFAAFAGVFYSGWGQAGKAFGTLLNSFKSYANMMRATSMGFQGYAKNREANHESKMKDVDFKLDNESDRFKGALKNLEQIFKIIQDCWERLRKAKKNELDVIVDGFRR